MSLVNFGVSSFNQTWYDEKEASYVAAFQARKFYYFGPIVLATCADNILLGLLAIQTWTYFKWFSDSLRYRLLVGLLFILNVGQSCLVISYVAIKFGFDYGNYASFTTGLFVDLAWLFEACAGVLAQLYFLEKAYRLSKRNKLLLMSLLLPIAGAFLAGISALIWLVGVLGGDAIYNDRVTPLILTFKGLTAFTDLALTGIIVFYLSRSKTGWKKTDKAVESFLRFIAEAQILPLLASLAFLASFAADPGGSWPALFSWADTKLYAISVCHVLNSRGTLKREYFTSAHSQHLDTLQPTHQQTTIGGSPHSLSQKKGIQVHTATHVITTTAEGFVVHQGSGGRRSFDNEEDDGDGISLESFERKGKREQEEEGDIGLESPSGSQARLVPTLQFSEV